MPLAHPIPAGKSVPRMILTAFAAACLVGLAACGGQKTAPPGSEAPPPVPFTFSASDPAASLQFRFPDASPKLAQIRDRLAQEARVLFAETSRGCEITRQELQQDGVEFRPCGMTVSWRETASAGTIVSYEGAIQLATGGAHPNIIRKSLICNLARGEAVDFTRLFAHADSAAALKELVCTNLRKAKAERLTRAGLDPTETFECPDAANAPLTLVRAEKPGTFAGMIFLFDPHAIGSYAEGPYDAFVPEAEFRQYLSGDWMTSFGGQPAPGQLPGPDGFPPVTPDFAESATGAS